MLSGQRAKPAALKRITGNPGGRPLRNEPGSPPLGRPPSHFDAAQRRLWREIADRAPPEVLRLADSMMVELAVELVGQVRANPGAVRPALATQTRQVLAELGMAPSARARLSVPPAPARDPFEGI